MDDCVGTRATWCPPGVGTATRRTGAPANVSAAEQGEDAAGLVGGGGDVVAHRTAGWRRRSTEADMSSRRIRHPPPASVGGQRNLCLITDAPVPSPGPGEVLIRVTAAGVNFVDISQARGTFAAGPQPPYLAGIEGAGEVIAVGEGVTDPQPGAHVIGVGIGGGAFAEYMVLPAAAAVPVPAGWADEQALGLVVNWPTALAALKPLGRIAAGQTVLIHAAAGGTGQAAVKMAKHYGATVIATASPGKHEVVWALGADHVIDSRGADLAAEVLRLTGGAGADLVLESVGGATLDASLAATSGLPAGSSSMAWSAGKPRLPTGSSSTSTRSTSSA